MLTEKRLTLRSCCLGSMITAAVVALSGCSGPRADISDSNDASSNQVIVSALSDMRPEHAGRIRLCHLTSQGMRHTLTVAAAAVPAHLAHGDSLGECPTGCTGAAACDDNNACTQDDCAASGMCTHEALACDDSDACTVDGCDRVTGCHHTGLDCDDHDECTTDRCAPSTGCGHAPIDGCGPPPNPCPDGMLPVDSFCIDKYEGALLEIHDDGSTSPWPPDLNPGLRQMLAVSLPGVIPQALLSEVQASAACTMAGKRLCTDSEWLRACTGAASNSYPYGSAHVDGVCNDNINLSSPELARTGEYAACVSEYQVNDLFGNLNEWTSDPAGTSRGGSYVDSQLNGVGCSYATTAHSVQHSDEQTGFRCCSELP